MTNPAKWSALACALVVVSMLAPGCKKPEDDAPPPPPPPPASSPAPAVTQAPLTPDDPTASAPAPTASAPPKGPLGPAPGSIGKCCDALKQNAKNAPPDQAAGYATAIAVCEAAKTSPQAQQVFAQIRAVLKGGKAPGACQ